MSGASATVQQAAEDACTTMQAALASLKDACDASCPAPSRQQVQSATHLLRMEVAKLGLVYNQQQQGSSPTVEEATALLGGFQQAVCTLCMLYTSIAAAAGGPTLRQSLHQTATSVVEACAALIRCPNGVPPACLLAQLAAWLGCSCAGMGHGRRALSVGPLSDAWLAAGARWLAACAALSSWCCLASAWRCWKLPARRRLTTAQPLAAPSRGWVRIFCSCVCMATGICW